MGPPALHGTYSPFHFHHQPALSGGGRGIAQVKYLAGDWEAPTRFIRQYLQWSFCFKARQLKSLSRSLSRTSNWPQLWLLRLLLGEIESIFSWFLLFPQDFVPAWSNCKITRSNGVIARAPEGVTNPSEFHNVEWWLVWYVEVNASWQMGPPPIMGSLDSHRALRGPESPASRAGIRTTDTDESAPGCIHWAG